MSSYNYSQLHEIIEKQYKKDEGDSNWFMEETFKFGKGYIKPSNYLNNVINKINETSVKKVSKIDEPLYLFI